jgi:hypothetical protein
VKNGRRSPDQWIKVENVIFEKNSEKNPKIKKVQTKNFKGQIKSYFSG